MKNNYLLILASIGGFWAMTCFSACLPESETLTPPERQAVDTLYAHQVNGLRVELDSLCASHKDSLVQMAADSILKVRMEEMQKILQRQ